MNVHTNIIPFARGTADSRPTSPQRAERASVAPRTDAPPIPGDLEALTESHIADLRMGSVAESLFELFGVSRDARNNRPHVPEGAVAGAVVELLAPVIIEVDNVILRLARRGAVAEAQELDRALSDLPQAEALDLWRTLSKPQQSAVIFVQQQAMTTGGAA